MSYPTSCGTNGTVTDISLACLNDIFKTTGKNCTTTFQATSDPHAFTLVGGPPGLLPFSTYGQSLSKVFTNMGIAQNYPSLCEAKTYSDPTGTNLNALTSYNAEITGLTAQYLYLYNQYTTLLKQTPEDDSENADLLSAYKSTVNSIKSDIDELYPRIMNIATTISGSIAKVIPQGETNTAIIETNATNLVNKIKAMQTEFTALNEINAKNNPIELDGQYDETKVKTTSSFIKNIFYILFAIFVIVCLVVLNISPTESKLDMFILALGIIILVYYIYNYFQGRQK